MASLVDNKAYFLEMYYLYRDLIGSQRGFNDFVAKRHNLTGQERYIIGLLHAEPGSSKKRIAKYLSVLMPSLTKSIERLENRNLLEKRSCGKDGRVCKHYLTPEAQIIAEGIISHSHAVWRNAFDGISASKIQSFKDVIVNITRTLDEEKETGNTKNKP